ncbi:DUF1464 family protein [Desulfurococcus amylolyticus]|uniref:Butyrate kinase n=1 Tax=Desulfurococcus amylolyticus (strain DSM 18924 / JCM 16383 / VKM B-2413 / 1221n) TaxID=490899 RepID=B8D2Y0_DESA1|nr:DUF1464 family protein [Desulfurococcus amylolyticus]ACL10527.1 Protein of unknown function (DUF1464) [Desulfurococcus amylolyticus 1221n]
MPRVLGMDPGSKSIDICGLCDGRICFEKSIDTVEASKNPLRVVELVEGFPGVDLIALPSGYGVELTYLDHIEDNMLEDWYYTFILATTKEEIVEGLNRNNIGAFIYDAMGKIVRELKKRRVRGIFIPAVINLETIPLHRKLNKIDMGTADKLAVAVLGIHEVSQEHKIPYDRVNYIHVEMGFGYNAVIAVRNGVIVDGVGGTLMPGPAFLTSGALDLEVVQAVGLFSKTDVFSTGCNVLTNTMSPEEFISRISEDPLAEICFDAMIESIVKTVYSMIPLVGEVREILLSGRVSRNPVVKDYIEDKLGDLTSIRAMKGLPDASIVKETAQGYAVIADGIAGGVFKELVDHVGIRSARGTSLDYIVHPRFMKSKLGKKFAELRRLMHGEAFNIRWWSSLGSN